jgi:hypothetical protein
MFKKLGEIYTLSEIAPEAVVKCVFNKWDMQLEEIIKCSEQKGCRKTYSGTYESSPIFTFWLRRVRLWRRALQHKLSPLPDPRNLYRDLKAQGFSKPSDMSFDLIHARISAVEYKLEECKQQAAELRKNHLDSRLE